MLLFYFGTIKVICQKEKNTCQTKLDNLELHHANEIDRLKELINGLDKNVSLIGMEKSHSKALSAINEDNYNECKEEKAECFRQKEELRNNIQQLKEQIAALNLKYTKCDFERSAHAECKEDKRKCHKKTRGLEESIDQLKSNMAALNMKYVECDTHRDDFEQCKVDKRELERNYKKLEADLNALNIEAITLNITHSSDYKEMKTCERRLHVCKVNMLDYMGRYEGCLKDKDSTSTESQKNDVICKVDLAKCETNLRQVIDTSSQCQEKLASCRWC